MMLIRVIDFETTGKPEGELRHAVCEVGWSDVVALPRPDGGNTWQVCAPEAMLTNPGRPIPPEARAVHHISDAMVAGAPPPQDAFMQLMDGPPDLFVAHNMDFEQLFFGGGEVPWVCTYKIALRIWPDAPSHNLQTLRYWLDLDVLDELAMPPHRAGPDAYVGAALMARMMELGTYSVADMVRFSKGPALLPRVTFGKHKGSRWAELPTDYLRWIIDKSDMDRDAKANAKYHIKFREQQNATGGF